MMKSNTEISENIRERGKESRLKKHNRRNIGFLQESTASIHFCTRSSQARHGSGLKRFPAYDWGMKPGKEYMH